MIDVHVDEQNRIDGLMIVLTEYKMILKSTKLVHLDFD